MKNSFLILILILCNLSFGQTVDSDCKENFILSNSEINTKYNYNAQNSILTENNYTVNASNDEIKMKAGSVIVLMPNTYIKKGSLYLAKIEDCQLVSCENLSIQKGISPDNNSINDYLDLSDHCDILNLEIFNRYGFIVYKKENYINEWNGKNMNGNLLPVGVYYYYISYKNGKQKTGWIYLNY
ncbi:MAG: gliding motility-associated-like protein [Flavobacterium sp.]|jgi:gliding motility-associated-like protein